MDLSEPSPLDSFDDSDEYFFRECLAAHRILTSETIPLALSRQPTTQSLCTYSLLGYLMLCCHAYTRAESPKDKKTWLSRRDDGIAWAVKWVSAPRTTEDMKNILERTCHCDGLAPKKLLLAHAMAEDRLGKNDKNAIGCRLISQCLFYLSEVRNDAEEKLLRPDRIGQRRRWPRQLHELLPHGPIVTLNSIAKWISVDEDINNQCRSPALAAIETVMQVAHTLVMPHAPSWSNEIFRGIYQAVQYADQACHYYTQTPSDKVAIEQSRQDIFTCLYDSSMILKLFQDCCPPPVLIECIRTGRNDLFKICIGIPYVIRTLESSVFSAGVTDQEKGGVSFKSKLRIVVTCFLRMEGLTLDEAPGVFEKHLTRTDTEEGNKIKSLLKCYMYSSMPEHLADIHRLEDLFIFLTQDQKCRRVGCPRTFEDVHRVMRVCAGCRRLQYCSSKCQKAAWTQEHIAHREYCIFLGSLDIHFFPSRRVERQWQRLASEEKGWSWPSSVDVRNSVILRHIVQSLTKLLEADVKAVRP